MEPIKVVAIENNKDLYHLFFSYRIDINLAFQVQS